MPTIAVQCPGCKRIHEVNAEYGGRRVRCQHCGESFTLPKPRAAAVANPGGGDGGPNLVPSPGFQCLNLEQVGGVTVARLVTPRPDAATVETLGTELLGLVKPKCKLVVDLEAVEFLSSAALGKLVALDRRMQGISGGVLRLCCMSPTVQETFARSGLETLFHVSDDRESALAGL